MSSISMTTLHHLNVKISEDVTQPKSSSMCGAYALVGAVGALGHFVNEGEISYENGGPGPVKRKVDLEGVKNFHDRCKRVYSVTGILNNEHITDPKKPELLQKGKGLGNSPAAMAQVVDQLGAAMTQIHALGKAMEALLHLYSGAKQRCIDAVGEKNIKIHPQTSEYNPPKVNQVHIVFVKRLKNGNLHWLAQGSDGGFYDPADGSTGNMWNAKRFGDKMGEKFRFLGLWIVVSLKKADIPNEKI